MGGLFDCDCACAAPPNFQPMADASAEAARVMAQLGQDQLVEARRQYDLNRATSEPVVQAQLGLMNQQLAQGQDYYDYMVSQQRPVENALNAQALQGRDYGTEEGYDRVDRERITAAGDQMIGTAGLQRQQMLEYLQGRDAQDQAQRGLITGGDTGIYNSRRDEIEAGVGRAQADVRAGTAQQQNQLIRQGLRYGWSPNRLASIATANANTNIQNLVAASNAARQQGIGQARADLANDYNMRGAETQRMMGALDANRNMAMQEGNANVANLTQNRGMRQADYNRITGLQAQDWAKKLDVAGLYRNLPGASQGAYGLAVGAGNSAVQNTMAPGTALMGGMGQGANTIGQGQALNIQGLGNILNAQTSFANSINSTMAAGGDGGSGQMIGSIAGAAAAFF